MTASTDEQTRVRREIVVDVPADRAFRVFTEQFDRIKPRDHNLLPVPIAETVFETHVGGHVYDRGEDGSECRWARVLAFDPPERFVISWDIGRLAAGVRSRPHQRGGGAFRARGSGPHPGRARAPAPRPAWRGLAGGTRRVAGEAGWPLYLQRYADLVSGAADSA